MLTVNVSAYCIVGHLPSRSRCLIFTKNIFFKAIHSIWDCLSSSCNFYFTFNVWKEPKTDEWFSVRRPKHDKFYRWGGTTIGDNYPLPPSTKMFVWNVNYTLEQDNGRGAPQWLRVETSQILKETTILRSGIKKVQCCHSLKCSIGLLAELASHIRLISEMLTCQK